MVLLSICTLQKSRELSALCHSLLAGIAIEGDPSPYLFSSSKSVTTCLMQYKDFCSWGQLLLLS